MKYIEILKKRQQNKKHWLEGKSKLTEQKFFVHSAQLANGSKINMYVLLWNKILKVRSNTRSLWMVVHIALVTRLPEETSLGVLVHYIFMMA